MPSMPPSTLEFRSSRRQIDLIVYDKDLGRRYSEKADQHAHGMSAAIHECGGFEQPNVAAFNPDTANITLKLGLVTK